MKDFKPFLVFQTDFTYKEGAVSAMYGVVKTVDRELEIFTGSHELPHFDAWSASYRLWQTVCFWPVGTVFVSVVDPGVGTSRRASAVKTKDGYYIFTPDNGTLTHIAAYHGIEEILAIDYKHRRPAGAGSAVFDGRDLFGYNAARFASGQISFDELGEPYSPDEIVSFPLPASELDGDCLKGYIEIADPNFGNLWTNITAEDFAAAGFGCGGMYELSLFCGEELKYRQVMPFSKAFGDVAPGEPLMYTNELLRISAALSEDNMLDKYSLGFGPQWKAEIRRA